MVTTPIGHQDEDIPKEGDLQNVPLHSNDKTTLSHWEYSILLRNSCWQLLHRSCTKGRMLYLRVGASTSAKVSPGAPETHQEDTARRLCGDGGVSARSGHPEGDSPKSKCCCQTYIPGCNASQYTSAFAGYNCLR